jgi:methylated-DNA-[protein]-cysteine S-methyltransferase
MKTSSPRFFTVIPSPIGPLTLEASPQGLSGIFWDSQDRRTIETDQRVADERPFTEVRRQLDAYFAGQLRRFDLPLDLRGTPFQLQAWQALQKISYGSTIAYSEQAHWIGNPKAVRAIGLANGRNPISIIVPCHRVIGKSGKLTGYGGGLDRKRFLLELEKSTNS